MTDTVLVAAVGLLCVALVAAAGWRGWHSAQARQTKDRKHKADQRARFARDWRETGQPEPTSGRAEKIGFGRR